MKWIIFGLLMAGTMSTQNSGYIKFDEEFAKYLQRELDQSNIKYQSEFTSNGQQIVEQNIIAFFAMDDDSRKLYTERLVSWWESKLNLKKETANLLRKLSEQMTTASDAEILKTFKQLQAKNDNSHLSYVMSASNVSDLPSGPPKNSFEVNQVSVIMAGFWGGIIVASLAEVALKGLASILPNFVSSLLKVAIDDLVTAAGWLGKKIGQGISLAGQWIGHAIKKIFGGSGKKKGKKGKKGGGNTKSVMLGPDGQADCCGLPFPVY